MTVAIAIITVLHLIVAVALVFLILLHAGKGGLGDMFGGGMQASGMGGSTLAERNLDRMTVIVAILFAAPPSAWPSFSGAELMILGRRSEAGRRTN